MDAAPRGGPPLVTYLSLACYIDAAAPSHTTTYTPDRPTCFLPHAQRLLQLYGVVWAIHSLISCDMGQDE